MSSRGQPRSTLSNCAKRERVLCVHAGPGGVTGTLCVHLDLQPAHLLAGRAQRGRRPLPPQLPAGVADGVLQPSHGAVCGCLPAHPADLSLHGQRLVHRLLPDRRLCHQH